MTRFALSALALAAALAGPAAAAQEVRLNVAGKDDAAVRSEIRNAVETVCKAADRDGAFRGAYRLQNCLMDGESRAVMQFKAYQRQAARAEPTQLAQGASGVAR
jgi:hypothetical protein